MLGIIPIDLNKSVQSELFYNSRPYKEIPRKTWPGEDSCIQEFKEFI